MRQEELSSTELGYAKFLASFWNRDFAHAYPMPNPRGSAVHWHVWRRGHTAVWECNNLEDASRQFCWDYITQQQGNGTSDECKMQLREAISEQDDKKAELACRAVFKWGGVAKSDSNPSRVWVRRLAAQRQLVSRINAAIELLSGPDDRSNLFDGTTFLMNSATTKVYAFADTTDCLPIYDGRVGAALAMLAVRYCVANSIAQVPIELKFAWLDGRTRRDGRNPNKGSLTFPRLDGNDQKHARNMWRARRILNAAAKAAPCAVLQLERALFMIGYDVRDLG